MKFILSLIVLFTLASCGKKIEDRRETHTKNSGKALLTSPELWSIHSDRVLPKKIRVVINDMEFLNECSGTGNSEAEVLRTYRNGTVNLTTYAAFRQDFFDIDIFDLGECDHSSVFFSQDYVDQTIIDHPVGAPIRVVLRLRNL
ncbi:MAG: hypothetical protein V4598_01410 [Bdellovibrionota bacterium]